MTRLSVDETRELARLVSTAIDAAYKAGIASEAARTLPNKHEERGEAHERAERTATLFDRSRAKLTAWMVHHADRTVRASA